MPFDGFISYSHAADGRLAPAVQRGLHRLAKPWHRRRALWIFRDQTGLAVTPGLWSSIQTALDGSQYFVLMASPEAAGSVWVNREIEHWIATKTAQRILPVVTDGEWVWDAERGDFTDESTAVPAALRGVFTEEPFFLDLRWARGTEHLSLHHSRFRDAIAQLAAPMHGLSKDELEGEDVRQHRRAKRLRSGAVATLVVLALIASLTGMSAVRNAERARASAAEALRQQQVANEQRDSAQRSAEEARQQQELAKQQQARAAKAAAEAKQAEQAAQAQQRAADAAAAEAARQRKLADQATDRKQEQERLAKEAADRAKKAQKEADRLAAIAAQKQRLAEQAAAQADKQQRIAVSRRLVNQAGASMVDDPKTALMLGAAAQAINPDVTTRGQVTGVVTATSYTGAIDGLTGVTYARNGVLAGRGSDGRISLWNVSDPRNPVRLSVLADPSRSGPEFSPDGRTLTFLNTDDLAVLWDVTDVSHPARLAVLPDEDTVTETMFSGDGNTLVTADWGGNVDLYDITDRKHPEHASTVGMMPGRRIETMALSSRGLLFVDQVIRTAHIDITDPYLPESVHTVIGYPGAAITFSKDGTIAASGDADGTVSLYDAIATTPWTMPDNLLAPAVTAAPTATDVPTTTAKPTFAPGTGVDDDPADTPGPTTTTTLASPPPMPDLDPDYAPYQTLIGLSGVVVSVAFSADGTMVAAGSNNGTAGVWDLTAATGSIMPINVMTARGPIYSVSFDPTGRKLATSDTTGTTTVWNVRTPAAPDALATLNVPAGTVRATTFRPDGRSLLVARSGGKASTWNTTDPSRPVQGADLALRGGDVRTVAFSADSRSVAMIAADSGVLTVADTADPARTTTLATVPNGGGLLFSPDGRTLVVFGDSGTMMLWDVTNRSRPALLARVGGATFNMEAAFSPDGRTLATAGAGTRDVTLWNLANRSAPVRAGVAGGLSGEAYSLTFRPDGRYLVSGDSDSRVTLFYVADPAHPARVVTLSRAAKPVVSAAFSADGQTLATGDSYGETILWDTRTPDLPVLLARVRGDFTSPANGALFRRDGSTLAVTIQPVRDPATVMLWSYKTLNGLRADPAKYACTVTGRGLTRAEWAHYIPEISYQKSC